MKNIGKKALQAIILGSVILLSQVAAMAADMKDYSITPPFIQQAIKPNLLLMLDNSSSMYDLAYADEGQTVSGTITREPYYCYDQTYSSRNTYVGYFNRDSYYLYDLTNHYFAVTASLPASTSCDYYLSGSLCLKFNTSVTPNTLSTFVAKGNFLNWLLASKFDVEKQVLTGGKYDGSKLVPETRGCVGQGFIKEPNTADFVNYASTADNPNTSLGITFSVRGPYDSINPSAPSRGGQTYIEIYRGNYNESNCQAAIDLWGVPTTQQADLRDAIELCLNYNPHASNYCSGNPTISCTIDANCVFPGTPAQPGGCSNDTTITCSSDSDCGSTTSPGICDNIVPDHACTEDSDCTVVTGGTCSNDSTVTCTVASDCTVPATIGACSLDATRTCTSDSECSVTGTSGYCDNNPSVSCSTNTQCPVVPGKCSVKHGNTYDPCYSDADCGIPGDPTKYGTCSNPAPSPLPPATNGTCVGYVPYQYYGICQGYSAGSTGTCNGSTSSSGACVGASTVQNTCTNPAPMPATTLNYGPCVNPDQQAITKTKVVNIHTVQTCWSYFNNGSFSVGDYSRLTSEVCKDVYEAWGVCSADTTKICTVDSDCSSVGGTCLRGPTSILPGNPALICSQTYIGQFCTWNGTECTWAPVSAAAYAVFAAFCEGEQATVIDPTDTAANTSNYETTPPLISGTAVEAQLGTPLASLPVKVGVSAAPTGLIQEFGNQIRIGTMTFNQFGSATEASSLATAVIQIPKVCSNDSTRLCSINADCGSGNTCVAVTSGQDLDASKIIYPVGKGVCAAMTYDACTVDSDCGTLQTCIDGYCGTATTTVCTTDRNCTVIGQTCVSSSPGNHTTSGTLVKAIDDIRANAWTPFAEAYFNAIGSFALTSANKSRTDLRVNTSDFNEDLNPSQYHCQKNYVLLVTDGSSTADQKATVNTVADLYDTQAGLTAGTCTSYMGSKNLPIMAWIAKNMKISDFSISSATTKPDATTLKNRDTIGTYVVLNGGSNGLPTTDPCNSVTLLSNTATKGGTSLLQAQDPASLKSNIEQVLKEIAAGSASGTAASIVSNRGQSGANIITAIFYPEKDFLKNPTDSSDQAIKWIGDLQNYWYYFDPYIANSTIREDTILSPATAGDKILDLEKDYVIEFVFDEDKSQTYVKRYSDDTQGTYTAVTPDVQHDDLNALWKAGVQLYKRDLSVTPYRQIYVNKDNSSTPMSLTTATLPSLTTNWTDVKDYLQAADDTEALNIMKYVYGYHVTGARRRWINGFAGLTGITEATAIANGKGVWKLGDIVTSTPKVQTHQPLSGYHLDYGDGTYQQFIGTTDYAKRSTVYVGANDGMLHAINLGKVTKLTTGTQKAKLEDVDGVDANLGKENWAFIPHNALPYLKYFMDPTYTHLYYVDNSTLLVDASIKKVAWDSVVDGTNPACGSPADYENWCRKKDSWRTILIGGMGLGGATRDNGVTCTQCVNAPVNKTGLTQLGLSSFFALDVTDQKNPKLLWEFSHPDLGYATAEPAIVRISGKYNGSLDPGLNGKWFVVIPSGPTGPIDTDFHQFYAKSDKTLKLFVIDLAATGTLTQGTNYWVIDKLHDNSTIPNAFGGSLATNAIDTDKDNKYSAGYYSTDVVYIGYTKANADPVTSTTTWTKGGLLRLQTMESANPGDWKLSKVIDDIGPVTASIDKLYDDNGPSLWLYFGSGRYYYKKGALLDSEANLMGLYGIKEPCYGSSYDMTPACTTTLTVSDLLDQSTTIASSIGSNQGWYITLDAKDTPTAGYAAERVITAPSARTNGLVQFTTYKPTADPCGFGGQTLFWYVDYATGGLPPAGTLQGKITIQLSTGAIVVVDLSDIDSSKLKRGGRQIFVGTGKPPAPPPPADTLKKPVKKILQIQER